MKILKYILNIFLLFVSIISLQCAQPSNFKFKNSGLEVNKTIYIDKNFNINETKYIEIAAHEWQTSTNNIVQYKIVTEINIDKFNIPNKSSSIVIKKTNSLSKEVIFYDNKARTIIGYCERDKVPINILIVTDRIDSKETFISVVIHELGHSLGMNHNPVKYTLMYHTIDYSSYHITYEDMILFCDIYKCKANEMNIIKD